MESHHPIVDALEKGRGGEGGLLLRNHVETILEFLKKSESDSEFYRALNNDLEDAKEVSRLSPMLSGCFAPLHQNISTHRFFMANTTLRHAC